MAVTRSLCKSMGLNEEQTDTMIEEHANTIKGLKEERDRYKADAEKLVSVQKELDALKAENSGEWREKYDTLKQTFEDFKTETASREKSEKVKAAYTQLLKDSRVDEKRIDAILKITDLSKMQLDDNGSLVGADELSKGIKTEWSAFIQTTNTRGTDVSTPPNNNTQVSMTKEEIYAKDEHGRYKLSTAERQKALAESMASAKT